MLIETNRIAVSDRYLRAARIYSALYLGQADDQRIKTTVLRVITTEPPRDA